MLRGMGSPSCAKGKIMIEGTIGDVNIWVDGCTVRDYRGQCDPDGFDPRVAGCIQYTETESVKTRIRELKDSHKLMLGALLKESPNHVYTETLDMTIRGMLWNINNGRTWDGEMV